jgi:hypothetical protein
LRTIPLCLAALAAACGGSGGGGGRSFAVVATDPPAGATDVPLDATVRFRFSAPLDPASIARGSLLVQTVSGNPVPGTSAIDREGRTISFVPSASLAPAEAYTATVAAGVLSIDGKPLGSPFVADFVAVADDVPPEVLFAPAAGSTDVPTNARIVAVFTEPLEPASIGPATWTVIGPYGPVAGSTALLKGNRVLRFTPAEALEPNGTFTATLLGGPGGPTDLAGNGLPAAAGTSFAVGTTADFTPPVLTLTVNGIPAPMNAGLHLPRSGFTIDATFSDDRGVDPGSFLLAIPAPLGPEELPTTTPGEDLFAGVSAGASSASLAVSSRLALPLGESGACATVEDLAGNVSAQVAIALAVVEFPDALRPFEETQRVLVDFVLDRGPASGGNGTPDFEDDLLAYGLASAGDPAGTNAVVRDRCRAAVLAVASGLLGAAPGSRIELHPTALASPFTRIAVGGIDPADLGRALGDPTTGVVGRAWFDPHNADLSDDDALLDPPLGVFPGEMFLALGNAYLGAGPGSATLFGQTFSPLAPAFGGTPAGAHPLDGIVLAPGFDPSAASPAEMTRLLTIALAAQRFALSVGAVLAHELGHSLGLVETGAPPGGLFGTASKHDQNGTAFDVMVSSYSWNNLVLLPMRFRPLDRAYLREGVVLE